MKSLRQTLPWLLPLIALLLAAPIIPLLPTPPNFFTRSIATKGAGSCYMEPPPNVIASAYQLRIPTDIYANEYLDTQESEEGARRKRKRLRHIQRQAAANLTCVSDGFESNIEPMVKGVESRVFYCAGNICSLSSQSTAPLVKGVESRVFYFGRTLCSLSSESTTWGNEYEYDGDVSNGEYIQSKVFLVSLPNCCTTGGHYDDSGVSSSDFDGAITGYTIAALVSVHSGQIDNSLLNLPNLPSNLPQSSEALGMLSNPYLCTGPCPTSPIDASHWADGDRRPTNSTGVYVAGLAQGIHSGCLGTCCRSASTGQVKS